MGQALNPTVEEFLFLPISTRRRGIQTSVARVPKAAIS